jgi:hypothetical protein
MKGASDLPRTPDRAKPEGMEGMKPPREGMKCRQGVGGKSRRVKGLRAFGRGWRGWRGYLQPARVSDVKRGVGAGVFGSDFSHVYVGIIPSIPSIPSRLVISL